MAAQNDPVEPVKRWNPTLAEKMDILDNWFNSQDPAVLRTHDTIFIPKYNRKLGKKVVRGWRKARDSKQWDKMLKDEELLKEFLEEQLLKFILPPKRCIIPFGGCFAFLVRFFGSLFWFAFLVWFVFGQ